MQTLSQFLHSYLNLRAATLRAYGCIGLPLSALAVELGISEARLRRRQQQPDAWKPHEIGKLADWLAIGSASSLAFDTLAKHVSQLPTEQRNRLLQRSGLSREQLQVRQQNYRQWTHRELVYLASSLQQIS